MEEEQYKEYEPVRKGRNGFLKGFLSGMGLTILVGGLFFCKQEGMLDRFLYKEADLQASISGSDTQDKLQEMEDLINEYYLNDVDSEELESWMYKGVMAGLDDPYADYYTVEEYSSMMDSTSGSYKGIGAILSQDRTTGQISVVKCYEGTPAEEGGLLPGDVALKLNGEDISGMSLTELVTIIKKGESDEIILTVTREGEEAPLDITMVRRVVKIPTISYEMLEHQIGYIEISEFDTVTYDQFIEAKENLENQGMEKLIIDLRNNPGGNLSTVVQILNQVLPEGLIVYTEDKYGNRTEYKSDGKNQLTIPLAVLINGESASASEIFAGAVKDYGIGTLVGTTTFGKGIVQRIFSLSDGTAIKLTISKYYTPNGNDIHEKGIEPDVTEELDEELSQMVSIPKDQDNQLNKAIEVLEGK